MQIINRGLLYKILQRNKSREESPLKTEKLQLIAKLLLETRGWMGHDHIWAVSCGRKYVLSTWEQRLKNYLNFNKKHWKFFWFQSTFDLVTMKHTWPALSRFDRSLSKICWSQRFLIVFNLLLSLTILQTAFSQGECDNSSCKPCQSFSLL